MEKQGCDVSSQDLIAKSNITKPKLFSSTIPLQSLLQLFITCSLHTDDSIYSDQSTYQTFDESKNNTHSYHKIISIIVDLYFCGFQFFTLCFFQTLHTSLYKMLTSINIYIHGCKFQLC